VPAHPPASPTPRFPIVPGSAVRELGRYMPRLIGASMIVAIAEVASGFILDEPALLGAAALTGVFGMLIVLAGSLVNLGRERWLGPMLAASVYLLGLAGSILIPGAATGSSLLPILSVVLLVPGRGRKGIAAILVVAFAGSGFTLLMAGFPHPLPPLREPLGSIFASATLLGVAVLIMGALSDFAAQASESLDGMRRALQSHDADYAERAAIVASLGKLERKDTIEATGAVIVAALMRLSDVDLAGVFACDDEGLEILAVTGPLGFPVHSGDRLPAARARHVRDRSRTGPWAERWTNDPAFGEYGAAFTSTGILGQAYAPFFEGGEMIGVVAIGTRSTEHAEHLVADLPAVSEFAATAGLLLSPMLVSRREKATARDTVEAMIAKRAYQPVFQPIIELATGRTVGFEALTRFADGRRPDLVFGCADLAGVGLELELRTLEAAILAARELPTGTWLSLNVSPKLVVESPALAIVLAAGDRPLVLEITEHVPIDDYRAVRAAIEGFGPGVRVAVDDAGAGIANFSHLVELRPQLVKVDAGLIRDLDLDLARQAAVVGLVHFAAKAGCEVIAEGIETEAERATALALGVTHGQGFLMARPARVGTFAHPQPRRPAAALAGAMRWQPPVATA
jgi:EAL domain-containing protein (putative c-di-GMP-specific phosphodiesterase class I)